MQISPSKNRRSAPLVWRVLRARPRLVGCVLLTALIAAIQPADWRGVTRFLIAWNIGAWTYLALALAMMLRSTDEMVAKRAAAQDEGRFVMLAFGCIASIASLLAILVELAAVKDLTGWQKLLHIGLATSTIFSAWLFIHLLFALHYAHEYFQPDVKEEAAPARRGGLAFPSTATPDYGDFLYFSYVIGVASQTADVEICSRSMRRVSLAHSVVSFFFNTTILALMINIAAGLI